MSGTCRCSTFGDTAEQHFNKKLVAEELARYRQNGPGPTTRLLRDGLVDAAVLDGLMLDVGSGIGAMTFEGLDRGVSRAIAVDASAAYLAAAGDEAARRGRTQTIEFVHGDFVEIGGRLPSAPVVVLDRVVCCYPLFEPLLEEATRHAERCLAFSYPRDRWYVRIAGVGENARRWIAKDSFRTFVHSAAAMANTIRGAGFVLASRRQTWTWSVDVYLRAAR
jgi:magnesium-protoporphyrin O-methyltransferase